MANRRRCLQVPPSRLLSFRLGLIRTIEEEHEGYLTQMLLGAKLLLLGALMPDLPVCCVQGDLRCIYMSAAGGSQVEFQRPI